MKKTGFDRSLFLLTILLILIGLVMVYSASWPYAIDLGKQPNTFFVQQSKYAVLGIVLMILISYFPYRWYQKLAIPIYVLSCLLCIAVFTPLGTSYNTFARRWVELGPISFMPSDLMKFASVALMAYFLSKNYRKIPTIKGGFIPFIIILLLTVIPIYKQPNFSTTLVLSATLLLMYFVGGMDRRMWLFVPPMGAMVVVYAFMGESGSYRRDRFFTYLRPLDDFLDKGWQLSQALFAVSTGGFFGLGLGKSRQKFLYLSEAHNDFIFAIIAEELGFIGCLMIIILYLMFIRRGLSIATRAKDRFGSLLAMGITTIIGLQAFTNIAVAFGLIPPTGLVLPFISFGGTSLLVTMGMTGILLNISRQKETLK